VLSEFHEGYSHTRLTHSAASVPGSASNTQTNTVFQLILILIHTSSPHASTIMLSVHAHLGVAVELACTLAVIVLVVLAVLRAVEVGDGRLVAVGGHARSVQVIVHQSQQLKQVDVVHNGDALQRLPHPARGVDKVGRPLGPQPLGQLLLVPARHDVGAQRSFTEVGSQCITQDRCLLVEVACSEVIARL
jgi:hypothetical protein